MIRSTLFAAAGSQQPLLAFLLSPGRPPALCHNSRAATSNIAVAIFGVKAEYLEASLDETQKR